MSLCLLVVDDEEALRSVFSIFFERLGYDVLTARHGREAVETLHVRQVDIILLDHRMPVMDGLAFLAHLHEQQFVQFHKRVIFFSATTDQYTYTDLLQSPFVAYILNKPMRLSCIAQYLMMITHSQVGPQINQNP